MIDRFYPENDDVGHRSPDECAEAWLARHEHEQAIERLAFACLMGVAESGHWRALIAMYLSEGDTSLEVVHALSGLADAA